MIAPEILLGKAWDEVDHARIVSPELEDFTVQDGVPWTLTNTLLGNIGGFVIKAKMKHKAYTFENTNVEWKSRGKIRL